MSQTTRIMMCGGGCDPSDGAGACCCRRRRRRSTATAAKAAAASPRFTDSWANAALVAVALAAALTMTAAPAVEAFSTPPTARTTALTAGLSAVRGGNGNGQDCVTCMPSSATAKTLASLSVSSLSKRRAQQNQQHQNSELGMLGEEDSEGVNGDPSSSSRDELEFRMHVGKALDTLRSDYPNLLTDQPDFTIYDSNIEVVDPSGVTVHGIKTYKNSFRLLHAMVKFIYCPERSGLTFRMCFDQARQNIRIHWNAYVVPKEIFGGSKTTLHVDGISVYELDRESGSIVQHRFEQLLMNDRPIRPKEGVIAALTAEHGVTVPSFIAVEAAGGAGTVPTRGNQDQRDPFVLKFQPSNPFSSLGQGRGAQKSLLFSTEASDEANSTSEIDWDAYEAKNKSRKKFGLKPLSPEEFADLQVQVKKMDAEQRSRQSSSSSSGAGATDTADGRNVVDSFVGKLFGNVLKDTCETNFDCERPEVCCDFGFKKMCCMAGTLVGKNQPQSMYGDYATVPVPVDVRQPPNGGDGPKW